VVVPDFRSSFSGILPEKNQPFLNILVIPTVDRVPNMPTFSLPPHPHPLALPSFSYYPPASLFFPQKTPISVAAVANFY